MFDGTAWQLSGCWFVAGLGVPIKSGHSLQFRMNIENQSNAPNPGGPNGLCSYLKRAFPNPGNLRVWSYSAFVRQPAVNITNQKSNAWDVNFTGQGEECWISAGNSGTGGAWAGATWSKYIDTMTVAEFWNNPTTPVGGLIPVWAPSGGGTAVGTWLRGVLMDSQWHHLLWASDGTTMTVFIDGVPVAQGSAPAGAGVFNSAVPHFIGSNSDPPIYGSTIRMAEIQFIDGQFLDWTHFCTVIAGSVVPKKYTGLYGPNGFYLNWSKGDAVTSTTLGSDQSGNGNDFTPVNFKVTDVLTDFPGNAAPLT